MLIPPEIDVDFTTIDSFELDNHLVLLKKKSYQLHVLNPIASAIWQLKKNNMKNHEIATEISKASNIPVDIALKDIETTIAQWEIDLNTVQERKSIPPSPLIEVPTNKPSIIILLSSPSYTVKITLDSQVIANKIRSILPLLEIHKTKKVDSYLNVISGANNTYLIIKDGQILGQTSTESQTALIIFHHIVDSACKAEDWLVILHAAGVSWQGHGIIFPALGGSGKTTLTAALIKHGFDYINDDVIPILRKTGKLIPLPISLSIKSGSWPVLQSLYPELETLEVFRDQEPKVKYLPPPLVNNQPQTYNPKHIILPNYHPGATAQLEPLSTVSALQAIIEGESLFHLPLVKEDIAELINWLSPLSCHRLTYDKLDPAVALLHQFCMKNHSV